MSQLPVQRETELVDPFSGELVDVSDPQVAAEFLDALRGSKDAIDKTIRAVTDLLAPQFSAVGSRTLNAGGWELEQKETVGYEWDEEILLELLDAGLPQERYGEFINQQVSIKPKQTIAKQLETNPVYAEIIDRARTRVVKGIRVDVRSSQVVIDE